MTPQDLQRAFDGEAGAQDVASHVASCAPCNSALELLQTQRDAVQYLSGPTGDQPPQAAVEQILAESARAGREKLADLLYEMAKACLIVLPDLKRRVERRVEPREAPVVSGELRAINSRLEDADASIDVTDVPQTTPEETRALSVAMCCLSILENVEGVSERQQLAMSQLLIFEDKPQESEAALVSLLNSSKSLVHRDLIYRNLSHALIRQGKYQDAASAAEEGLGEYPTDGMLLFNITVAHAFQVNEPEFQRWGKKLGQAIASDSNSWLRDLVLFHIPHFAQELHSSESAVTECFSLAGVSSEERS